MVDFDGQIKDEWRNLGFYYDLKKDIDNNDWRFFGSKQGLFKFVKILDYYISEARNNFISEHAHYGPYNYLKIMTWNSPVITENYIAGTIYNLKDLTTIVTNALHKTKIGQTFKIDSEYGTNNTAILNFFVMADDFDPVSMDGNYN